MNFERTRWGITIGEKYLSAREALDLLQWLSEQQEALVIVSQQMAQAPPEPTALQRQQTEWSLADEEEMRSEDEQIAGFES
jgi:hypothetical protein